MDTRKIIERAIKRTGIDVPEECRYRNRAGSIYFFIEAANSGSDSMCDYMLEAIEDHHVCKTCPLYKDKFLRRFLFNMIIS